MSERPAARVRFTPERWRTHEDVLAEDERLDFEAGWVHVCRLDTFIGGENLTRLRSYPSHVIESVFHGD